jgi:hypothetical protein
MRPASLALASAGFVALALAMPAPAHAQAPAPEKRSVPLMIVFTAELSVELGPGTERCPDAAPYLRKEVADELGYDPFAAGAEGRAAGRFSVTLKRAPIGFASTNEFVDAAGEKRWTRTYDDHATTRRGCEAVLKGVAFQIVTELTRFEDEDPEPPPAPPPAPAPPRAAAPLELALPLPAALPVVEPPPPPPERAFAIYAGADFVANPTIAPAVSVGGSPYLGVLLCKPGVSFELGLRAMTSVGPAAIPYPGRSTSEPTRWTYTTGVLAVSLQRSFLFLGAVVEVGSLDATTMPSSVLVVEQRAFAAAGLHAGVASTFGDLITLRGAAELEGVMSGPSVSYLGQSQRPTPRFSPTLAVGFSFKLR